MTTYKIFEKKKLTIQDQIKNLVLGDKSWTQRYNQYDFKKDDVGELEDIYNIFVNNEIYYLFNFKKDNEYYTHASQAEKVFVILDGLNKDITHLLKKAKPIPMFINGKELFLGEFIIKIKK